MSYYNQAPPNYGAPYPAPGYPPPAGPPPTVIYMQAPPQQVQTPPQQGCLGCLGPALSALCCLGYCGISGSGMCDFNGLSICM